MKIKVFGFGPTTSLLPRALNAADVFPALMANNGATLDPKGLLRAAATTVNVTYDGRSEDWVAGMLLRARDSTSFNRLKMHNGSLMLTAEQLGDGKLAEMCYFLAHPSTSKGLIALYNGGPGIPALSYALRKIFGHVIFNRRKIELEAAGDDRTEKASIYERYKGKFQLDQLTRDEDIREMLREFKKLNMVELRFSGVKNTGGYLRKLRTKAVTETEKFYFPPGFELDEELTDELVSDVEHSDLTETVIEGKDAQGSKRRISSDMIRNKLLFAEEDYETMLGGLSLNLDDWAPTISASPVVAWLIRQTTGAATQSLLTTS